MSVIQPFGPVQLMLEAGTPIDGDQRDGDQLDRLTADLDAVDVALSRLDDGSFDSCELCGARIGSDRLLENPLLTRCPSHS